MDITYISRSDKTSHVNLKTSQYFCSRKGELSSLYFVKYVHPFIHKINFIIDKKCCTFTKFNNIKYSLINMVIIFALPSCEQHEMLSVTASLNTKILSYTA